MPAQTAGAAADHDAPRAARPRLACAITLGGWLVTEAFVLSTSKGIVHPYYVSAVAPGAAAMAGVGVLAMAGSAAGATGILGFLLAARPWPARSPSRSS